MPVTEQSSPARKKQDDVSAVEPNLRQSRSQMQQTGELSLDDIRATLKAIRARVGQAVAEGAVAQQQAEARLTLMEQQCEGELQQLFVQRQQRQELEQRVVALEARVVVDPGQQPADEARNDHDNENDNENDNDSDNGRSDDRSISSSRSSTSSNSTQNISHSSKNSQRSHNQQSSASGRRRNIATSAPLSATTLTVPTAKPIRSRNASYKNKSQPTTQFRAHSSTYGSFAHSFLPTAQYSSSAAQPVKAQLSAAKPSSVETPPPPATTNRPTTESKPATDSQSA